MPYTLIFVSLIILFGLLSYYLIFSCLSLTSNLPKQKATLPGVSLIICARNEYQNLQEHLPIWLRQKGIDYELILVNDRSTDESYGYLQELAKKEQRLQVLHLSEYDDELKGKRSALLKGIALASYDYVVLSDADCYPSSNKHLLGMSEQFNPGVEVVLGYSPYIKRKGFLNQMVQYETCLTAIQYLSFAKLGFPYMGVGRNIAYKKSVLNKEVFLRSNRSLGGDDDLVVGQLATKQNTSIAIHPHTFVYSLPPSSFHQWTKQKQRHYSTAKYYDKLKKVLVGGFGALNFLFYIALFILLLGEVKPFIVLSLYLSKLILFVMFNYRNLKLLKNTELLKTILFLDLFWIIFLTINHLKALRANNGWS